MPRAREGAGILELAGATLELQVEEFAITLVDRLGERLVVEGAGFVGEGVGHG